jgi:hypothetical protein
MTQPPIPPPDGSYPPTPPAYPPQVASYGALAYSQEPRVPGVWPWFIAYCVLMALMYAVLALAGVAILLGGPTQPNQDPLVALTQGACFLVFCVPLTVIYAVAPFLPRRPGVWVYDLVLICLGLTSICCLPATIPLLIFWMKPETKMWFGREVTQR